MTGGQAERPMVEGLENLGYLARVARDTDPNGIVADKDVVKNLLAASQLMLGGLALLASPQLVLLREALLELDVGCQCLDVTLTGTVVAGADADALSKPLLDNGLETVGLGELQTLEGLVGSDDAAGQR